MIDQNETIDIIARFRNRDGDLVVPDEPVRLRVRKPDGSLDEIANVSGSDGQYSHRYAVSVHGTYYYTFESNDGGIAQGNFYANPDKAVSSGE